MVQENVLQRIDSDRLRVHVVWMPVLDSDNRGAAQKAPSLIPDPRATHYWDGEQDLGNLYGKTIELPMGRELAWDIYFVFDAGVEWTDRVPVPTDWAHRLGNDQRHLREGDGLRKAVESLLSNLPPTS